LAKNSLSSWLTVTVCAASTGVGGGEVVVLTGVDDDAGRGVHLAAEALVDECTHRG
jgi:hypothetical protein